MIYSVFLPLLVPQVFTSLLVLLTFASFWIRLNVWLAGRGHQMSPQTQIQQPSKSLILQKFDSIVKDVFILRLISETLPALQRRHSKRPAESRCRCPDFSPWEILCEQQEICWTQWINPARMTTPCPPFACFALFTVSPTTAAVVHIKLWEMKLKSVFFFFSLLPQRPSMPFTAWWIDSLINLIGSLSSQIPFHPKCAGPFEVGYF